MDVSVVIVNYNVKYYTALCLYSVQKAVQSLDAEIWVVDNASSDGSVQYLSVLFPEVKWIVNAKNKGFGAANNQAARQASGKYILLLNPDTIIAEDTLIKCLDFMQQHPDAGAMGVKMIDSQGRFLRESKRGIPTLFTSFCKMSGLAGLFPHSSLFARYYLGHLPDKENNKVEILAGAFMLISGKAWHAVGGFDEDYFMYGEDIDLSYRLLKAGFSNYYFAGTTIVHFKGESTRQKDARYVKMFYHAMRIFAKKQHDHFFSSLLVQAAISLGEGVALVANLVRRDIAKQSASPESLLIISDKYTESGIKEPLTAFKSISADIKIISVGQIENADTSAGIFAKRVTGIVFYITEMRVKEMIDIMQKITNRVNYFFILPDGMHLAGHHRIIYLTT